VLQHSVSIIRFRRNIWKTVWRQLDTIAQEPNSVNSYLAAGGAQDMWRQFKVIDADAHMHEPEYLWDRYVESKYRA